MNFLNERPFSSISDMISTVYLVEMFLTRLLVSWTLGAQGRLLHSFRDFKISKWSCWKSWFLCPLQTTKPLRAPPTFEGATPRKGPRGIIRQRGPNWLTQNLPACKLNRRFVLCKFFLWEQGNMVIWHAFNPIYFTNQMTKEISWVNVLNRIVTSQAPIRKKKASQALRKSRC